MSEQDTAHRRRGDAQASRLRRLMSSIRAAWLDPAMPPATPTLRDYPVPPFTARLHSRKN